jgi:hypothetical protein
MTIDKDGKVGIGTQNCAVEDNAPNAAGLHIAADIDVPYTPFNTNFNDPVGNPNSDPISWPVAANNLLKLENVNTGSHAFAGMQFRTGQGGDCYFGAVQTESTTDNVNNADFYFAHQNAPNIEIMRLTSSGNVGIGTANPDSNLHLVSPLGDGLRLGVASQDYYHMIRQNGDSLYLGADDGDAGGSGADIRFNIKGSEKIRITSAGMGIGAESPDAELHIGENSGIGKSIRLEATGEQEHQIQFASDGVIYGQLGGGKSGSGEGDLRFHTYSSGLNEAMCIDPNGNVGIGTIDPDSDYKLEVKGKVLVEEQLRVRGTLEDSGSGHILLQNNFSTGSKNFYIGNGYTGSSTAAPNGLSIKSSAYNVFDWSSANALMHITETGNVGIGTTDPIGPLHIQNTTANQINLTRALDIRGSNNGASAEIHGGALVNTAPSMGGAIGFTLKDSDGTGTGTNTEGIIYFKVKDSGASLTEKMRINSDGNVGIGTMSPSGGIVSGKALEIKSSAASILRLNRVNGQGATIQDFSLYAGSAAFEIYDNKDDKSRLVIKDGNVGIGTTQPAGVLDMGPGHLGRSIAWGGPAGTHHYASVGTTYSSADLYLGNGFKAKTNEEGFVYSYGDDGPITHGTVGMKFDYSLGITYFYNKGPEVITNGADFNTTGHVSMALYPDRVEIGGEEVLTSPAKYEYSESDTVAQDGTNFYVDTDVSAILIDGIYEVYATIDNDASSGIDQIDVVYGKVIIGSGGSGGTKKRYVNYVRENPRPRDLYESNGTTLNHDITPYLIQSGSASDEADAGTGAQLRISFNSDGKTNAGSNLNWFKMKLRKTI